jgi:DNA-binding transcriptional MerR regulator
VRAGSGQGFAADAAVLGSAGPVQTTTAAIVSLIVGVVAIRIGEAARRSGLSIDTIRYYESLGLIEGGARDAAGRRVFGDEEVLWLVFLCRMRETGMPVSRLREYVMHRRLGVVGIGGVLSVLRDHRQAMERQVAALSECIHLVDDKLAKYERLARTGRPPGAPEV